MRALPREKMVALLAKLRGEANTAASEVPSCSAVPPPVPLDAALSSRDAAAATGSNDATNDGTAAKRRHIAGATDCVISVDTPRREGCLSPGVALRLAQSSRKSAAMSDAISCVAPSPVGLEERGFRLAEENRLLAAAQKAAAKVFEHVRRRGLPTRRCEPTAYHELFYLRTKHKNGYLTVADYQLLARIPCILGPTVYGDVEPHGDGYRWTFTAAGVDVQSDTHLTEIAAVEDLCSLQQKLYPGWEETTHRAAHLQCLLCLRAKEKQMDALARRHVCDDASVPDQKKEATESDNF